MAVKNNPAKLASDLRLVLGQLVRRLRAEGSFPITHLSVLGRLDRGGAQSVSDLAALEHMRPQSMAQTVKELEGERLISRRPDPGDRRRALVELTREGIARLEDERRDRVGWLAAGIAELETSERDALAAALPVVRRLAESDPAG
jgi:DNA-binding MarR family transcriptional regulator